MSSRLWGGRINAGAPIMFFVFMAILALLIFFPGIYTTALCFLFMGAILYQFSHELFLTIAIAILVYIPPEAQILLTGVAYTAPTGGLNLHILTYYVVGGFVSLILANGSFFFRSVRTTHVVKRQFQIFFFLFAYEFLIDAFQLRGAVPTNQFPDVYVGPVLFYAMIIFQTMTGNSSGETMLNRLVFLSTPLIPIAFIEYFLKKNLFIHSILMNEAKWYAEFQYDYLHGWPYRITTTLGHPLTNGMYFLVLSLWSFWKSNLFQRAGRIMRFRYLMLGFLFVGPLLLTFSRVGIVLFAAGLIFLWYYSGTGGKRFINFALLLIVVAGFWQFYGTFFGDLAERGLTFSDPSSQLRIESAVAAISNISKFSLIGQGVRSVGEMKLELLGAATRSNFEVGWLLVIIQYGIIFLVIYLTAILLPIKEVFSKRNRPYLRQLFPSALIVVLLIINFAGSNSIGERTTINYLFFLVLGTTTSSLVRLELSAAQETQLLNQSASAEPA